MKRCPGYASLRGLAGGGTALRSDPREASSVGCCQVANGGAAEQVWQKPFFKARCTGPGCDVSPRNIYIGFVAFPLHRFTCIQQNCGTETMVLVVIAFATRLRLRDVPGC